MDNKPIPLVLVRFPEASVEVLEADLNWQAGLLNDETLYNYFLTLGTRQSQKAIRESAQAFVVAGCEEIEGPDRDTLVAYLIECAVVCMDKLYTSGHYKNYRLTLSLVCVNSQQLVFTKTNP
jgi:hypothetical protein